MADSWRGYSLAGGHIALDLVNTVSWRGDPPRRLDRLELPGFFTHWLEETGLGRFDGDLSAVYPGLRELRELLYALLAEGDPAQADLDRFGELLAATHARAKAEPSLPVRWSVPVETPDDLLPALVLRADELLRSPETANIRRCEGRGCAWLFIDSTRNHSRRWCRSDDCGNRERARRHYQRTREPV
ncbi:CGNR zinc finger domain-containing protein [Amycolatopsis magusensis]|uniref:RNA-binding Zn ribbon-like protein n=1 Tax=Amycolatopsis magusensis TaxID=882444 RepID=A0ABS4Q381_9PSEU|nr:CGNR zinc finger domain-containing protein [Amycolatopsis magusensis]MBP2186149.1 putative RNA-binding Zn ribbon-like protein [Amycolatopsis magusensis]